MNSGKLWAKNHAKAVLNHHDLSMPPVPIEKIAEDYGVMIQYAPFDDALSGMAFIKDGKSIIGVNSLHHPNRQRFTVAHELGHHVMHQNLLRSGIHVDKTVLKRDKVSAEGIDLTEIEANAFASEILMPSHWIDSLIAGGLDVSDEVRMTFIAKKFKVSTAALNFRLLASA